MTRSYSYEKLDAHTEVVRSLVYDGSRLCCQFHYFLRASIPSINAINSSLTRGFFEQELNLFLNRVHKIITGDKEATAGLFSRFDNSLPF